MGNIAASQCKDSGFGPGAVLWENQAFVKSTKFPYKNAKDCVCATEGTPADCVRRKNGFNFSSRVRMLRTRRPRLRESASSRVRVFATLVASSRRRRGYARSSMARCEGYGDLVLGPYSKTKCSDGKSFSCTTADNPNIKSDGDSTSHIAVPWSKKGSDDYKKNSAGKWFRPASKSPSRRDEVG